MPKDQIAAARRIHNSNVTAYNTRIHSVPSSFVAAAHRFDDAPVLSVTQQEFDSISQVQQGFMPLERHSSNRTDWLAGAAGFEPANGGTKSRCLTAWRRPNAERGNKAGSGCDQALKVCRLVRRSAATFSPRNRSVAILNDRLTRR